VKRTAHWQGLLPVFILAAGVHALALNNFFYTHDGYSAIETGQRILRGELWLHDNVLRLLPTLSFAPRAYFGMDMVVWHLPHILLHAINAMLVLTLARRMGLERWPARLAGVLFGAAPLLAHAVEWLGAPYDLFAATGVLGASIAFLDRRPWRLLLFALVALLSKETALVLPALVVVLSICVEGQPQDRQAWWSLTKRVFPLALLTALCIGLRWMQFAMVPYDLMVGRQVGFELSRFVGAIFPSLGVCTLAPFGELLSLQDPSHVLWMGLAGLGLLGVGGVARRTHWRMLVALTAGAALVMVPVLLIGSDLFLMVFNTRYLYLSAALLAPALALILMGNRAQPGRWAMVIALVATMVTIWGGVNRVHKSTLTTAAVRPVFEVVQNQPKGTQVWIHTNLYDEATVRLLMSRWLHEVRGVRGFYVLRGTGQTFARTTHGGMDASANYFAISDRKLYPPPDSVQFLQTPTNAALSVLPSEDEPPPPGTWSERLTGWTPHQTDEGDDDPISIASDNTFRVTRMTRPASAQQGPAAVIDLPAPHVAIGTVEITYRAHASVPPEYGVAHFGHYASLYWDPFDHQSFVSFAMETDGQTHTVTLDLSADPVAATQSPARLGLLPLNVPGEIILESIRVRR
jgi:hypothetical protein